MVEVKGCKTYMAPSAHDKANWCDTRCLSCRLPLSDHKTTEVWYRYIDHRVSLGYDYEFDRSSGSRAAVYLREYDVLRHTPKGVWLDVDGADRFVLKQAHKRFACPTIEEAKQSFIARKLRQVQIHEARVRHAKEALQEIGVDFPLHSVARRLIV